MQMLMEKIPTVAELLDGPRGLHLNVDHPLVRYGSVAIAAVCAALMFAVQKHSEPTAKDAASKARRLRRDLTVYGIVVSVTSLMVAAYYASRDVIARRLVADPFYPRVQDTPIAFLSMAALAVSRIVVLPPLEAIGRRVIPRGKWSDDEYAARVQRFAGQGWKILFHSFVTVLPFTFLEGQSWWPPRRGDLRGVVENYPLVPAVPWLREYYMFQIGYYFLALLITLVQRGRANYVQMTVHHMATLVLTCMSYFIQNNIRHGTLVLWLHDVCDVPVCITRGVVDLPYVLPTAIGYVWLMVSWVFYRLILYPYRVVYVVAYKSIADGWLKWEDLNSWYLTTPMLFVLVVLHWVWFFELLGMAKVYFRTGHRADSTDAHKQHTIVAAAKKAN